MQNGTRSSNTKRKNNFAVNESTANIHTLDPTEDKDGTQHYTNGVHDTTEDGNENFGSSTAPATPSRKRKYDEANSSTRSVSRAVSPPWRKVAVDGPTSFVIDGRRKSSRTNALPLELQPNGDKRLTRSARESVVNTVHHKRRWLKNGFHPNNRKKRVVSAVDDGKKPTQAVHSPSPKRPMPKPSPRVKVPMETVNAPASHTRSHTTPTKKSPRLSRLDGSSTAKYHLKRKYNRRTHQLAMDIQSSNKGSDAAVADGPDNTPPRLQRIRLKLRPQTLPILNPAHRPLQQKYASLSEWLSKDDPLEGEDAARISDTQANRDAATRVRLLDAAQPGGPLSREKCTVYQLDAQDEPPRQYGHMDHLAAHAVYFRTLMRREWRQHQQLAKKIAHEAQDRWQQLQEEKLRKEAEERRIIKASRPKTMEDILEEQQEQAKVRYLQLVRDLLRKWELVRAGVQSIRFARWEEEQQAIGKQALNEMLDHSTKLLDKRRAKSSDSEESEDESDMSDDENSEDSEGSHDDSDAESVDSANMSSTETTGSDPGLDEDTQLTVEQLRERYPGIGLSLSRASSEASLDENSVVDVATAPPTPDSQISEELDQKERGESDYEELPEDTTLAEMTAVGVNGMKGETPPLEEVDPMLLDDSDEASDDMDDDLGDSDEDMVSDISNESAGEASEDEEENEEDEDYSTTMLGFLGKADIEKMRENGTKCEPLHTVRNAWLDDDKENADVEMKTDRKGQSHEGYKESTGLQSFSTNKVAKTQPTNGVHNGDALTPSAFSTQATDQRSADPSSQPSPMVSTNARPTDAESVSSIEMQDSSSRPSEIDTPAAKDLKTEVPSALLRGTLREYQHFGLDWLAKLYENNTNGILADEMGLGKTIQTIALLAHLAVQYDVWGPHLVVVPTSVMLNWEMEFKKWCPGFKILTYYGSPDERKRKRQGWQNNDLWNVCITSYQLVLQDEAAFKRRNWHYLVLDEAHNIKNFQTQRWQKLLRFKTHSRLLLTGTPLQNNLTELWSLLFFLMPHGFDQNSGFAGLQEFLNAVRRPADQILDQGREKLDAQAQETVTKLHEVLRPYLLRRLKADVEKQMPGKYEHVVYCRLSKRQRQLYDGFMSRADTKRTLASGNYMSIINCLMSLRKVCNHPDLFETRQIVTSFAMPKSAVADFEIKDLLVRRRLLESDPFARVSFDALNLLPVANEGNSMLRAVRTRQLEASRQLTDMIERQSRSLRPHTAYDGTSIATSLSSVETARMSAELELLQLGLSLTRIRSQRLPLYGSGLIEQISEGIKPHYVPVPPKLKTQSSEWSMGTSALTRSLIRNLTQRSESLNSAIRKFGCITPAVVVSDILPLTLTEKGMSMAQLMRGPIEDPFHESRIRLSIAFPDKRLLQYDCGKLQRLEKLLRDLQAGGHRALIFTQMTKVLDILEQFLNIHGHRYLRLDGATKIEQRQILTDRFNNDPRILVFILSSRSGGLGINLTGADTVIFYDLDWNPAMDKQCQDRCHRIGQTRDVHIYRFVSEYTIEANILRKSNQKRLLDDVIIQKGDFTTDYFNRLTYKDALDDDNGGGGGEDPEAGAAMDKVLGDLGGFGKVLESVEDKEDTEAAKAAQREMVHVDDADFAERVDSSGHPSATPKTSVPPTPVEKTFEEGGKADEDVEEVEPVHVDEYMLRFVDTVELAGVPLGPPPDKSKKKRGQEHRIRVRRR